jgi:acyl dehydratase
VNAGDILADVRLPRITRDVVTAFGVASGDLNPIHMDPEVARSVGHEDVIVHGMYVMAMVGNHVLGLLDPPTLRAYSVRFVAVTPVDTALRITVSVAEQALDAAETTTLDVRASRDDGTEVLRGTAVVASGRAPTRYPPDNEGASAR